MGLGITLAVCTYNGAALLPETLRHIAQQQVSSDIPWEVLIIDNASADNTVEVVASEWAKYNCVVKLTLLHQPKPGLTYARELAIEKSKYEFILFCDDDNWLDKSYVSIAYELMQQHTKIGILGGYGEAVFETPPPYWATNLSLFAVGPQAPASGKVKNNLIYGAGSIMRKSAYKKIVKAGFKSMLTDRKGNNLSSGGDYELCFALALAGYDIWYDERLRFKHFTVKRRLSQEYYNRFYIDNAKSFEVLIPYRIKVNLGTKDVFLFHLQLCRVFMSYLLKLTKQYTASIQAKSATDKAQAVALKLVALKYKLLSFQRLSQMRSNFLWIQEFEKAVYSESPKQD